MAGMCRVSSGNASRGAAFQLSVVAVVVVSYADSGGATRPVNEGNHTHTTTHLRWQRQQVGPAASPRPPGSAGGTLQPALRSSVTLLGTMAALCSLEALFSPPPGGQWGPYSPGQGGRGQICRQVFFFFLSEPSRVVLSGAICCSAPPLRVRIDVHLVTEPFRISGSPSVLVHLFSVTDDLSRARWPRLGSWGGVPGAGVRGRC